jgi:hypothetical protein
MEGQIWSDVPEGEGDHQPFGKPFRLEVWNQSSVPAWLGGTDLPLATFDNLRADDAGTFVVRDLPTGFIPNGVYNLRAIGDGTLPYLYEENLRVESPAPSAPSPHTVTVTIGPLSSGDLNGDNVVDDADLNHLVSNFGREVREVETGQLADFNDDGVVDGQDFSLMAANYGRQGK